MSFDHALQKMNIHDGVTAFRKNRCAVLLDVRTESEFSSGYISGAINVPLQEIEDVTDYIPNKNTKIYVYCRSGVRSAEAAKAMAYMGYGDVVDIGGILYYHGEIVR